MTAVRMRTPAQKRAAVERLLAVWLRIPDERLGQLLLNACPAGFFYAEDEALLNGLESRVRETPPFTTANVEVNIGAAKPFK